jgi:hypothetical protein
MTAWDPLGLGDEPEAWDEYDSYLSGVAQRLREAANEDEAAKRVAEYLHHVERDFMGLAVGNATGRDHVASALAAWHEWSFVRRPRSDRTDDF